MRLFLLHMIKTRNTVLSWIMARALISKRQLLALATKRDWQKYGV